MQSYRQTVKPIISMAIGSVIKLAAAYILIGIPEVGVYGAPISTLICNIVISAVNIYFIGKRIPKSSQNSSLGKMYVRPTVASVLAIAASFGIYTVIFSFTEAARLSFLAALCVAVIAYIPLVFLLGAVRREDVSDIPMGDKLLSIYDKLSRH